MFKYRIEFSKYKLRAYERKLAIMEFENQFPMVTTKNILDNSIDFTSTTLLDENKLRKLTFFSSYNYQNKKSSKVNAYTEQTILENFSRIEPNLFNQFTPNGARDIRYLTHSFHEYKGRFYPQIVKSFINYAGLKKQDIVLDPFCGSGTTLVESLLYGVNSVGVDINPIAVLLANAKVKSLMLGEESLNRIMEKINSIDEKTGWNDIDIDDYRLKLDVEYLLKWFPINNLKKIFFIQNLIDSLIDENSILFARVILSNLLRKFSYQDPTQLRIRRRKDKPDETLIKAFKVDILSKINTLTKFLKFKHFALSSNVQINLGDIRNLTKTANLEKGTIDLVITSPPYATALPYVDTDRLSLFALGYTEKNSFKILEQSLIGNREITKSKRELLDLELEKSFATSVLPSEILKLLKKVYSLNRDSDVGFRRKNTAALLFKYFIDMQIGMEQVAIVLRKNKYAFWVVGNNKTKAGGELINIPTDDFISLIAQRNHFKLIKKLPMTVQKSYMIHSKNSINSESILIFQRV